MKGLLRCSRYGFSPNKLKYCGPDKNKELEEYIKERTEDWGLEKILGEFSGMRPYLKLIAKENGIEDEFDEQVVEAYWLGNGLLDKVSLKGFFNHGLERLDKKSLRWFEVKLGQGAKPNHSFHVFNFWKRTGHVAKLHTIETMDSCRISAGKVVDSGTINFRAQASPEPRRHIPRENLHFLRQLSISTDQLVYKNGKLGLEPAVKEVNVLEGEYKSGDLVTFHWNMVCEKITEKQQENLEKYTKLALKLANITI